MGDGDYSDLLGRIDGAERALELFEQFGRHDRHLLQAFQAMRRAQLACGDAVSGRAPLNTPLADVQDLARRILPLMDDYAAKMLEAAPTRKAAAAETRAKVVDAMLSQYLSLDSWQVRWLSGNRSWGQRGRPSSSVAAHIVAQVSTAYGLDDRTIARHWTEYFLATDDGKRARALIEEVEAAGKDIERVLLAEGQAAEPSPHESGSATTSKKLPPLKFGEKSREK